MPKTRKPKKSQNYKKASGYIRRVCPDLSKSLGGNRISDGHVIEMAKILRGIKSGGDKRGLGNEMAYGINERVFGNGELKYILPAVAQTAKAKKYPTKLTQDLYYMLKPEGKLNITGLKKLSPVIVTLSKEGFYGPETLTKSISWGLKNGILKNSNLDTPLRHIKGSFDELEKNGYESWDLALGLENGFMSKGISNRTLPETLRHFSTCLRASKDAGYSPHEFALRYWHIRDSDKRSLEMLRGISPMAIETAKGGHDPWKFAYTVTKEARQGSLTKGQFERLRPTFLEVAKAGFDPHDLISDGIVTPDSNLSPHLVIERLQPEIISLSRAGINPKRLLKILNKGINKGPITSRNVGIFGRASSEILRNSGSGKGFKDDVQENLTDMIIYKKLTPHMSKKLAQATKAVDGAGDNTNLFMVRIRRDLGHGNLDKRNFTRSMDIHINLPRGYGHHEVMRHAMKVRGVPSDKIPEYQKALLEKGYFPTKGLIEEMHKPR